MDLGFWYKIWYFKFDRGESKIYIKVIGIRKDFLNRILSNIDMKVSDWKMVFCEII